MNYFQTRSIQGKTKEVVKLAKTIVTFANREDVPTTEEQVELLKNLAEKNQYLFSIETRDDQRITFDAKLPREELIEAIGHDRFTVEVK